MRLFLSNSSLSRSASAAEDVERMSLETWGEQVDPSKLPGPWFELSGASSRQTDLLPSTSLVGLPECSLGYAGGSACTIASSRDCNCASEEGKMSRSTSAAEDVEWMILEAWGEQVDLSKLPGPWFELLEESLRQTDIRSSTSFVDLPERSLGYDGGSACTIASSRDCNCASKEGKRECCS
eukprot:TRINITY_DN9039_c0_g1_i1.p2 TRINITY_DN9039_c0_g1~~TRINITY_DN9039_c0_g1_i1.p2  ORF type:complete len:181 (-),score=31.39 TRINITY_DN9039_c0_g1_i1:174-716(-)